MWPWPEEVSWSGVTNSQQERPSGCTEGNVGTAHWIQAGSTPSAKAVYITGHLGLDGQRLRLRQRKPQRLLLQRKQLAKMSVRPGTESPARGRVGCGRRRPLLPRTGEDHTAQCGCSVRGNRDRRPPCSPCETSLFQKRPADEWTRQAPYRVHTHRLGQSWRQSSAEAQGRQHGS